jgi:transposase
MLEKRVFKRYTKEFKEESVALVIEQSYSVPESVKSLSILDSLLMAGRRNWKNSKPVRH